MDMKEFHLLAMEQYRKVKEYGWSEFNISPFKVLKFTFKDQYSSGLNCSISCSLSVNNLRATDWTLPADFEPGSLDQSIGEILNPTR